jgi:DNA-binding response OmpR family regulator
MTILERATTNKDNRMSRMIKRKILIVDDEYDITFVFKIILEERGFATDIYNDPIVALSNYKSSYYDLVMVDLRLPGMTGFELYNQIRMIDKKTKVCFLTSSEQFHQQYRSIEFQDFNPDLFIQKPIENDVLISRINSIIET